MAQSRNPTQVSIYNGTEQCQLKTNRLDSLLQRIMPPILQRPVTPTPGIPLRMLLLRQMPLTVRDNPAHML
jgi:hypothetical protein